MRKEYFENQLKKILAMDIEPYEKYLKVKNNPNLTFKELQEIIKRLPSPSSYPQFKDKRYEVLNHKQRLETDFYYKKYLKIKDNPNLTFKELQEIIKSLPAPSTYPENRNKRDEVVNHKQRLQTDFYYQEYLKIKDKPTLAPRDLQKIVS